MAQEGGPLRFRAGGRAPSAACYPCLPPRLHSHLETIERFAAHAVDHLLYVRVLAILPSGSLMSSAKGFQTVCFDVLPLPDLLDENMDVGDLLQTVHVVLNFVLIAVLLGHVGAALKHHFINKDDVLPRTLLGSTD